MQAFCDAERRKHRQIGNKIENVPQSATSHLHGYNDGFSRCYEPVGRTLDRVPSPS